MPTNSLQPPFHVTWHRRPMASAPGPLWTASGRAVNTIACPSASLCEPWDTSFEDAVGVLVSLDRMFCEPDGAFVWRPSTDSQIEGTLFDRASRLVYVELKGRCSKAEIDLLHAVLNPARRPLAVQVPRHGVVLDWLEWRDAFFN